MELEAQAISIEQAHTFLHTEWSIWGGTRTEISANTSPPSESSNGWGPRSNTRLMVRPYQKIL